MEIQENRHHHLLNSRSEYNRCAVPRLMCKLGDNAFKKYEKEIQKDLDKEEEQISKIRQLAKTRNRNRNKLAAPPPKRRKLDMGFENTTNPPEQSNPEKRKSDTQETGPTTKKRRTDLREIFRRQEEKKLAKVLEQFEEEPEADNATIFEGETETVEMMNWEELFREHQEETAKIEKERRERQDKAEKQEQSWELLRVCVGFIKETETSWKVEEEERLTDRQKKERLNKKQQAEKRYKEKATEK